ncbi:MAG: hypothetical protein ACO1N3_01475 [Gammaproteobacteria bacterium]
MQDRKWNLSTVNMLQALTKVPTVDRIPVSDLQYTVLDTNIVYRDALELAELHAINPKKPPKDYVAYRPERLALHEVIVAASTQLQLSNDAHMQYAVRTIHNQTLEALQSLDLDTRRVHMQIECEDLVQQYIAGEDIRTTEKGKKIHAICKEIQDSRAIFGEYLEHYTEKNAMVARATDILFTEMIEPEIRTLVQSQINTFSATKFPRLVAPDHNKRHTFMINGGPASGKGSSVERLKINAEEQGISWDNVVKVNTDSYKSLLLEPGTVKPELYSQLAQEEAATVHQKIQQRLISMAKNRQAPHVFFDQVFPGIDKIDYGLLEGGCVRGIVVSTDVEDAISRSYARGLEDGVAGRYESSESILRLHKLSTEQLPVNLSKFVGEDVQFSLVDNNVPKDSQAEEFMVMDLQTGKIEISDPVKAERFIKKTSININAKSEQELYNGAIMSTYSYCKPLVDARVDITVVAKKSSATEPAEIDNKLKFK